MAATPRRTNRNNPSGIVPDRVNETASGMNRGIQSGAHRGYVPQQNAQMPYVQQMPRQAYMQGAYDNRQARQFYNAQQMPQQPYARSNNSAAPASNGTRGFISTPPGKPPKKSGKSVLLTVVLVLIALAIVAGGALAAVSAYRSRQIREAVTPYDNLFCQSVYVDGIHLGGMTPEQAMNSVQSRINERSSAWKVTLIYQGQQLAEINASMLGMNTDVGKVLNDAWLQGHSGTYEERLQAMEGLKVNPYHGYTAAPSGDTSVIDTLLGNIKAQIDTAPQDARLTAFDPEQSYPFVFQEDVHGWTLDISPIKEQLYQMVAEITSGTVEIVPTRVEPSVKLADLQQHYALRSSVYTPISTSSTNERNDNIRTAFGKFNGYVLQPGKQFSFNGVVGQRTTSNGFKKAIEYAYGEHVEGIGGGVCQASTTLYQAAVCAGLQIIKREPHSDSVNYTEYGKDATVYWNGKRKIDFVFKNNTDEPIYIVAAVQADPRNRKRLIAKVSIYGADMGDTRYEMECQTVRELDPPDKPVYVKDTDATYVTYTDQQKSVSKPKKGYVVESYRLEYAGSVLMDRKMLYSDTYEPKAERIYVGVKRRGE